MIFTTLINGLLDIIIGLVNLFPSIPSVDGFNSNFVVETIEAVGYVLPIQSMLACFGLWIVIKRWQLFVNIATWAYEKIPFVG